MDDALDRSIPDTTNASERGWTIAVTDGPNKGAAVPLDGDQFTIGAGLSNDIVIADGAMAPQQAVVSVDDHGATLESLAPGLTIDGKDMVPGAPVAVIDGTVLRAGDTVFTVSGPARPRSRAVWLLAIPAALIATGVGALGGLASPGRTPPPPIDAPRAAADAPPVARAAAELSERVRANGLGEQIRVEAAGGAVVAEGALGGPDLARWSENQVWFDSRYKGSVPLVNRVREAAPDERPDLQLRAVSTGQVPYLITRSGDRYVEGAVVNGWTIEQIAADKVVLSRGGRRVELGL